MKIWEKWKALIIFVGASIVFIVIGIFYQKNKSLWDYFSIFDTSTAIALAILAVIAYWELGKGEDDIELIFEIYEEDKKNEKEPCIRIIKEKKDFSEIAGEKVFLLRKNITRAEIQGILGAFLYNSKNRYNIPTKDTVIIIKRANEIRKGKGKKMLIPITRENYEEYFLGKKTN